ncbi:DUF397 domain-containing protein [Streptomyces sp. JW3]|uniref:DUF397 domain-containing protein n=1 Tax=Streptomyces sp. JW3 TaxID=3456955 RepID=UPI003FA4A47D
MTDGTVRNAASLEGWRKSSYSNDQGGSCLEVADGYDDVLPVRDSKMPHGPAVVFPASVWAAFVSAVQDGPR